MVSAHLSYWIPLFPLIAAVAVLFWGRWLPWKGAMLSIAATVASFLMSVDLYLQWADGSLKLPYEMAWTWFSAEAYTFYWSVLIDGPSLTLLLVVTFVSTLVQVYSLGYMEQSPRFSRFFAYLSLFTFSMLGLVVANNYLQFFAGWEVMGLCSYLLISFEFERDAAGAAGNKAFITTRLGDLGFLAGLLTIFYVRGTFHFGQLQQQLVEGSVTPHMAGIIALLIFCGTVGKSAQVPLHGWLPDAMEGPTPVSALIHAATMVAAGVYLFARTFGFFQLNPDAMHVAAWIGGISALMAATMALAASDIKRVLAYSTMSQLGYMVMSLGLSGYSASLFHLTTHAAFKALLFLGAGSVIHAVHTNDLWKMGSLSKQMLTTTLTFFAGFLALTGFPFTSGFFSKDMVLAAAFAHPSKALFVIAMATVFLTSLYMTRAFALAFLGEPRERDRFAHAQESPWSMTIPLIVLAVPSLLFGFWFEHSGLVEKLLAWPSLEIPHSTLVMYWGTGLSLGGMILGGVLYAGRGVVRDPIASFLGPIHRLWERRYYLDEVADVVLVRPTLALARLAAWFDRDVIDACFYAPIRAAEEIFSVLGDWTDDASLDAAEQTQGWKPTERGPLARLVYSGVLQNGLLLMSVGFLLLILWKVL